MKTSAALGFQGMQGFTHVETHPKAAPASLQEREFLFQHTQVPEKLLKNEAETRIWMIPGLEGNDFFFKEYKIPWPRMLLAGATRSRAAREFRALLALEQARLPVAFPEWFAESRRGPFLAYSVLVTRSLGDVLPLSYWLQENRGEKSLSICAEVGRLARRLHDLGFAHFRMQAKNFMVQVGSPPSLHLLDVPYACRWPAMLSPRIRALDLEDLCGTHSVLTSEQVAAVMEAYRAVGDGTVDVLPNFYPGSRSRWGQKLRRIAYYLAAIWSGHRP